MIFKTMMHQFTIFVTVQCVISSSGNRRNDLHVRKKTCRDIIHPVETKAANDDCSKEANNLGKVR